MKKKLIALIGSVIVSAMVLSACGSGSSKIKLATGGRSRISGRV